MHEGHKVHAIDVHMAIVAACGCQIDGVSIGRPDDKSTWRVDFASSPTDEQRAAAKQAIADFVV